MSGCDGCSDPYCGDCAAREYLAAHVEVSDMKQAIEVPRAIVIQVAQWYPAGIDPDGVAHDGELVLETVCRDYDHYRTLPDVVIYEGTECGKTGWSSDNGYACYKSGAAIAHSR